MYCGGSYESSTADAGRTTFPEKEAQKRKNDLEDIPKEVTRVLGKNNTEIDANKMYNIIQNLDIYKAYMNIANFINDYDNDALTKNEKNEIVKEWYNIYNEDLPLRTKQKIESIIPKKIAEEYGLYNGVMMDEGINLINPSIII